MELHYNIHLNIIYLKKENILYTLIHVCLIKIFVLARNIVYRKNNHKN